MKLGLQNGDLLSDVSSDNKFIYYYMRTARNLVLASNPSRLASTYTTRGFAHISESDGAHGERRRIRSMYILRSWPLIINSA